MSRLEQNKTYFLSENVSGASNGECRFRFEIARSAICFYFDAEDEDLVSPFTQDNEDIWQGDAVEVFISPDGDLKNYKELEVSPFGVRFYGAIRNEDGKTPVLTKQAPPFAARVERTEKGYRVSIELPLSALDGFDEQKMKLNAFRLDKKADGRQLLYALNPTLCASFHRPAFFM